MTAFVLDVSVIMAWCFEDESSEKSGAAIALVTQRRPMGANFEAD